METKISADCSAILENETVFCHENEKPVTYCAYVYSIPPLLNNTYAQMAFICINFPIVF